MPSIIIIQNSNQTEKIKAIRHTTVRETGVSRHHGDPIEGHPKTSHSSIILRGLREAWQDTLVTRTESMQAPYPTQNSHAKIFKTVKVNTEILLNQIKIRFHLPFSNWFGTGNGQSPFAVINKLENGKYNLISIWFNKIPKRFVCVYVGFIRQNIDKRFRGRRYVGFIRENIDERFRGRRYAGFIRENIDKRFRGVRVRGLIRENIDKRFSLFPIEVYSLSGHINILYDRK